MNHDVGLMVADLIAAGCAPEVAAKVVATAFVMGASSVDFRGIPVDETAEKRRVYDRERKRKSAEIHRNSTGSAEIPETPLTKNSNSNSKRQNRGTRIAPDWSPSDAERAFAKQEGFSDFEVQREADKFRGYWVACAGSKAVKLNWSLTWENWVRRSAESAGKAPTSSGSVPTASDKLDWDAILQTYKKIGIWSKWAGPDLSSPACRAPREMLEKYGLLADGRVMQ